MDKGTHHDQARIRRAEQQRQESKNRFEELKRQKSEAADVSPLLKFGTGKSEVIEQAFNATTVGLQTREEFAQKRATIEAEVEREQKAREQAAVETQLREKERKRKKKREQAAKLSFADDELEEEQGGEEGEDAPLKRTKFGSVGKNPTVETSFLPDRDREREEQELRDKLKKEWLAKQEAMQNEALEITYSYWDGSGHRRKVEVRKGDTIGQFLHAVREQLGPEFRELRSASAEGMLYIKEDLIIPHSHTFAELITNKARGKSGPLFHFDVHDDVRVVQDARVEKDESHAGKVVERHWYEKNKSYFPASRWELYDPTKDYGGYTIHGSEVN